MHHIKDENGTLITDIVQIANTLGAAIEKSSSSENYSKEFQSIKAQKEKRHINFKTNKKLRYNKKFTMRDLKRSLKKSNNSSSGPDQIHYEILRHLPIETLHILSVRPIMYQRLDATASLWEFSFLHICSITDG